MPRISVIIFLQYFLPGFKSGGPVRSIAGMVDRLSERVDFHIVSRDRDVDDTRPYPGVQSGSWHSVARARVYYVSGDPTLRSIEKLLRTTHHELIYLNGLFSTGFSIKPLVVRRFRFRHHPVLIAPRGECAPPALALKRWKKRVYLKVARFLGLFDDVVWHASSEYEAIDVRRVFGAEANVVIAPNLASQHIGTTEGGAGERKLKEVGKLRMVAIARCARMKNLSFALEALEALNSRDPEGCGQTIDFDIYGPLEDREYWRECQLIIERLPVNITVRHHGPVPHTQVEAVLRNYDVFFLPSLGENFGHAILDALRAGTPVLISDRTPWRGLTQLKAGWDLPVDQIEPITEVIRELTGMTATEHEEWVRGAIALARRKTEEPALVETNLAMFGSVAHRYKPAM